MQNIKVIFSILIFLIFLHSCSNKASNLETRASESLLFNDDVAFLKDYTDIIVLTDKSGESKIAVSPALQGRVMTSTTRGDRPSFGWINRELFESGDSLEHMNPFGGEDRIWLGPEGGQFSIYFEKEKDFNLDNWFVPSLLDLEPFEIIFQNQGEIIFSKDAELTNYSGTNLHFTINRKVRILEQEEAVENLKINIPENVDVVAYESVNSLKNTGEEAWKKESGLLSIWILGMFNPSEKTTVIIPFNETGEKNIPIVNDDYFGKVPSENLKVKEKVIYFKGDGEYRSKIGLSWARAKDILGSYNTEDNSLTVVQYNKPAQPQDYVNSAWEIQQEPYNGDVINAYNDGPPSPGAKPLGPFYELETSSPAAELTPEDSIIHTHRTFHFTGGREQTDELLNQLFKISIGEIDKVF
ncbi:hypothetical protein BH23BAC1_BH23BAC1_07370 [soil metagenome]